MGTVISMTVGVLAALSFIKKDLYQPWIYLVNVSLAVYISLFASPLILELTPTLPGVAEKYRTAGCLIVTAVILLVLFYKIVGLIAEDSRVFDLYPLPSLINKLCSVLFAFCGGVVTAAFLLMCFAQTPVAAEIKGIDRAALRASSTGVMRKMAGVVNAFSFQSMSREADETLVKFATEPPPIPEETLEEKVNAKKAAAAKKAKEKARKKMRILENGVAVPVEETEDETEKTSSAAEDDEDSSTVSEKEDSSAAEEKEESPAPVAQENAGEKIDRKSVPAEENAKRTASGAVKTESETADQSGKSKESETPVQKSKRTSSSSRARKTSSASGTKTTVYGRAVSKALEVRGQVEKNSSGTAGNQ